MRHNGTTKRTTMLGGLILLWIISAWATSTIAGTANITWDTTTMNIDGSPITNLSGYRIYYGTAPGMYTASLNAGLATSYQVNDLADGTTYYFSVTAYNTAGNESDFSHETSKSILASQYTLTTTRAGSGTGTITSSPAGISCGSSCSSLFNAGAGVTLTAMADPGSVFSSWSGVCSGPTTTCLVTMDAARSATAAFTLRTYTISASSGTNGTISPTGAVTVNHGASRTFTITPATGYSIADVLVDNVSAGTATSYTFTNVTANHTISANFAIKASTYSIIATAGVNGTISPSGTISISSGSNQTYSITPAVGYIVSNVLVDGVSVGAVASYTFSNITANHTISASFVVQTYTITATAGANGTISPSGTATVSNGTNQSYAIIPATGYHVADVLVDSVSAGTPTSYTFSNVTANHTISAMFSVNTYTLTTSRTGNGSGTITSTPAGLSCGSACSSAFNFSTSVTLTATPSSSSTFSSWSGACTGSGACMVTMDSAKSVSAAFRLRTFTISASSGTNGSISPAGNVMVNYGSSRTFAFTPAAGYHVANVLVNTVSAGTPTSYTFTNVRANHTIAATFSINTYTITATAGANGSVSPAGSVLINHGASRTYTITPAAGYHVADVLVDGISAGAVTSYTFNGVTTNHTISASFAINTHTITAGVTGSGGTIFPSNVLTVPYGGTAAFTITPDTGYHIVNVLVDNVSVGAVNSYTFSAMNADHTISATFAVNTYTILASAIGGGSISPSGPVSAVHGGNAVFSITANAGTVITDVRVDGVSLGKLTSYTFTNITANHSIEAVMVENLSCPDPGIPCVERVDGQPDGNNLVNGMPDLNVVFEFRAVVADDKGTPRSVKLATARQTDPAVSDLTYHEMTCTGDFGTGAVCTYRTELPPAVQHVFTIEAELSDGTRVTYSQNGYINGPQIDLITSGTFTVALQPGWNGITNPYREDIELSTMLVKQGATPAVPWLTAAANTWVKNDLYDLTGSEPGRTHLADHAGIVPGPTLAALKTYWIYLNRTDAAYSLVITRPLPK